VGIKVKVGIGRHWISQPEGRQPPDTRVRMVASSFRDDPAGLSIRNPHVHLVYRVSLHCVQVHSKGKGWLDAMSALIKGLAQHSVHNKMLKFTHAWNSVDMGNTGHSCARWIR